MRIIILSLCLVTLSLQPFVTTFAEEPKIDQSTFIPLNKSKTVLLDKKGNRVLIKSKVVLRRGPLEMLLCKKQTKEHESILSTDADAFVIHTGLLALKAKTGKPVSYEPKYLPPTGQKINVFLRWKDKAGKSQRVKAQDWIHNSIHRLFFTELKTLPVGINLQRSENLRFDDKNGELSWYGPMSEKKRDSFLERSKDKTFQAAINKLFEQGKLVPMQADFIFVGSGFTKEKYYLAEDGYVICVANFPPALIDVTNKSSKQDSNLTYEAHTKNIPPKGTDVTIELIPVFEKKPENK